MSNQIELLIIEYKEYVFDIDAHIVLLLDSNTQQLPWESIENLKSKSVSRMPSMKSLKMFIEKYMINTNNDKKEYNNKLKILCKNIGYVLNPTGDLVNTQNMFENRFKE